MEESIVTIKRKDYCSALQLSKGDFDEIRKPFVQKRKSTLKVNQLNDNLADEEFDVNEPPDYVKENEEYRKMWRECNYYPRL